MPLGPDDAYNPADRVFLVGKDTMERLWKATIGELQVGPRVLEQGHTIYTTKVYTIQQGLSKCSRVPVEMENLTMKHQVTMRPE